MTSREQGTPSHDHGAVPPPGRFQVEHLTGDRFGITVRGHRLVVDQPVGDGGDDTGPTPTELFAASLASCVAFYAGRYLTRHGVDPKGLRVDAAFTMATGRTRTPQHARNLRPAPPRGGPAGFPSRRPPIRGRVSASW